MISIVIPVYQSEQSLNFLMERIETSLSEYSYEVIFVDDCSKDESWETLKKLKTRYGLKVKIIRLLFNMGQHNALCCGFQFISPTTKVVVTMDDDLQNPPEEILTLIAPILEGIDVCIGAYEEKKHSKFRNFGGFIIDFSLRKIFSLPNQFQLTSFRAINPKIIKKINSSKTIFPYVTAQIFSHSFTYENKFVRHDARMFGQSNYNIKNSVGLALNLFLYYSYYPLYLIVFMCLFSIVFTGFLFLYSITQYLLGLVSIQGWTSTISFVAFVGAQLMVAVLILSVYIIRMNKQMNATNQYPIDEELK